MHPYAQHPGVRLRQILADGGMLAWLVVWVLVARTVHAAVLVLAEPRKLMAAGWQPVIDTETAITRMVQAASPRKSGTASRSTP